MSWSGWQAPFDILLIAGCASDDGRVHAWTVNNRNEMEALIEIGVDGIFTDDPVPLHDMLER